MRLSDFPTNELASILANRALQYEEFIFGKKNILFRKELQESLLLHYYGKDKHSFLVELLIELENEQEQVSGNRNLDKNSFFIWLEKKFEESLVRFDLSKMEMSKQKEIQVIQKIISKLDSFTDELSVLKSQVNTKSLEQFEEILGAKLDLVSINTEFWNKVDNDFNHGLGTDNNMMVETIIYEFGNFYQNLVSEIIELIKSKGLKKVVVLPVEGEDLERFSQYEIDENGHYYYFDKLDLKKEISTMIQSRTDEISETVEKLAEIKWEFDDGLPDMDINGLLNMIRKDRPELGIRRSYELLSRREIVREIMQQLDVYSDTSLYKYKPEVDNLALWVSQESKAHAIMVLKECHQILNNLFIKCPSEIFISLFFPGQFIAPVNWFGKNYELNYLIKGMKSKLAVTKEWERAGNCFYKEDGTRYGNDSIRSHGSYNDIDSTRKVILDKVIQLIQSIESV